MKLSKLALMLLLVLNLHSIKSQTLLVDFGATEAQNIYNESEFPGWNTIIKSVHTDYSSANVPGLTMISGSNRFDNFQRITGSPLNFEAGDVIILSWYNNTGTTVSNWRPLISFTDLDNPTDSIGEPQWYAMDSYGSSPVDAVSVNYLYDQNAVKTVYVITSTETAPGDSPPTEGTHGSINICNNNEDYKGLILDKIEILRANQMTLQTPDNLVVSTNETYPYSAIDIKWDPVESNVENSHYRIYRDGIWIGKTEDTSFTEYHLEPNSEYTYKVKAVNILHYHSEFSENKAIYTSSIDLNDELLGPEDIEYVGAFQFPNDTEGSTWNYRRGQPAYYPKGDPNQIDGDTNFVGSLYISGHTYERYVAEISIPTPAIVQNPEELPRAQTLQQFHNIEPANSIQNNYVSVGLTYLNKNDMFYSTFYYWYNVAYTKLISHAAFEPDFSNLYGSWWVGKKGEEFEYLPKYDTYAKFLGEIPEHWAMNNTPNHYLLSGGQRGGGSSPDGPGLVAIKAWDNSPSVMPSPDSELSFIELLTYKSDEINTMNNWIENDYFDGVAWTTSGNKSSVIFAGSKGYGEYYYGFTDGVVYSSIKDNIPVSHSNSPSGKGGCARSINAMLLFYNPNDLERVAKSQQEIYSNSDELYLEPHEPQPYAALDIDKYLFKKNPKDASIKRRIESITYDRERGYLYIIEPDIFPNSIDIIHVFQIKTLRNNNNVVFDNKNCENLAYPVPFSYDITIPLELESESDVSLTIIDMSGREVTRLLEGSNLQPGNYTRKWTSVELQLNPGIYYYVIKTSEGTETCKIIKQ